MAESRRDFILGVQLEVDNHREMDDLLAALEAVRTGAGKPFVQELEFRERGLDQIAAKFEQLQRSGRLDAGDTQAFSQELSQLAAGLGGLRTQALGVNPALNQLAAIIQRILSMTSGTTGGFQQSTAAVGELRGAVTGLNTQLEAAEDGIDALTRKIEALRDLRDFLSEGGLSAGDRQAAVDDLEDVLDEDMFEFVHQAIFGYRGGGVTAINAILGGLEDELAERTQQAGQLSAKLTEATHRLAQAKAGLGQEVGDVIKQIEREEAVVQELAKEEANLEKVTESATVEIEKQAEAADRLADELERVASAAKAVPELGPEMSGGTALIRRPQMGLTRTTGIQYHHGYLVEDIVERAISTALVHIPTAEFIEELGFRGHLLGSGPRLLSAPVHHMGGGDFDHSVGALATSAFILSRISNAFEVDHLFGNVYRPGFRHQRQPFSLSTGVGSGGNTLRAIRNAVAEGVVEGNQRFFRSFAAEASVGWSNRHLYLDSYLFGNMPRMTSGLSPNNPAFAGVGAIAGLLSAPQVAGLLPPPRGSTVTSGFTINRWADVVAERVHSMSGARFGATDGGLKMMYGRDVTNIESVHHRTVVGIRQLTQAQTVLSQTSEQAARAVDNQARANRRQQQAATAEAQAKRATSGGRGGGTPPTSGGGRRGGGDGADDKPKRYSEMNFLEQFMYRLRGLSAFAPAAFITFGTVALLREATREAIRFQQAMADIQAVLPSRNLNERFRIEEEVIASARRYGVSLMDAAEAARFFAQAGFDPRRLTAAMDASLMAVAGAGLDPTQAQELILALDAITQGSLDAVSMLDRVSRVEASRAVTAQDLVAAITRVGPIAHQLKADMIGISDEFDTVIAATTGIVERTRMTGMQAATALRFISARLGSPDIVGRLQEIGGIRLGRTAEQLRPIDEILFEIAKAHERLTAAGETAKATQLLVALGGARQLSATTALIQSYQEEAINAGSSIMDLQRESALAFGDMEDRARTSLNTLQTELDRTRVSFVELGSEIIKNPLVDLTLVSVLKLVQGALFGLSLPFQAVTELIKQFNIEFGKGRFAVNFLAPEDIEDTPQVRAFQEYARNLGLSGDELLTAVGESATGIAATIQSQFDGRTLSELIDLVDRGALEARHLRDEMGERLANELENVNPRLAELRTQIDAATTAQERHRLQTERIVLAYEMLSRTAYMAGGVLAANNQRILDSFEALGSEAERVFSRGQESQYRFGPQGRVIYNQAPFEMVVSNVREADAALNRFLRSVPADLKPVFDAFFTSTQSVVHWRRAIEDGGGAAESFGTVLDRFAERVEGSKGSFLEVGQAVRQGLVETLNLMDNEDGALGILTRNTPGFKAMETFLNTLRDQVKSLIEERGGTGSSLLLTQLDQFLSSPQVARAVMLQRMAQGFTRISDELTRLFLEFYRAEAAADAFGESFRRVGLDFDETGARFESASNLLRGLLTFESNSIARIIQLSSELEKMRMNVFQAQQSGFDLGSIEEGYSAVAASAAVQGVLGNEQMLNSQAMLRHQIDFARTQLEAFRNDGLFMSEILGTDPEAVQAFEVINRSLELLADNASDADALKNLQANYSILIDRAERLARLRAEDRAVLEREKQDFEHLTELEEIRSSALEQVVSLRNSTVASADLELQTELALLDIKRQQVESDALLGDITRTTQLRELDLAEQRLRIENQIVAVVESYVALSNQAQQNVRQSLSGIQSMFTDASGFLRSDRSDRFSTLLKPFADTILSRTSENLFEDLFDVNEDNFLGRLSRRFGEAPEVRMRRDLDQTFERAGMDISRRFVNAGDQVASALDQVFAKWATVYGDGSPVPNQVPVQRGLYDPGIGPVEDPELPEPRIDLAQTISPSPRRSRTERFASTLAGSMLDEQIALLLGSFGATAAFGGGPNAGVGSGIGGLLGGALGNKVGEKWGSVLGSALMPGVGTVVGALAGGWLGSLFDDDDSDERQIAALQRIDQNTRETADVLVLENRLLDAMRGAINVPSRFTLPQYVPLGPNGGGSTFGTYSAPTAGSPNLSISNIEINVNGVNNPTEIASQIQDQIGSALQGALRRMGLAV